MRECWKSNQIHKTTMKSCVRNGFPVRTPGCSGSEFVFQSIMKSFSIVRGRPSPVDAAVGEFRHSLNQKQRRVFEAVNELHSIILSPQCLTVGLMFDCFLKEKKIDRGAHPHLFDQNVFPKDLDVSVKREMNLSTLFAQLWLSLQTLMVHEFLSDCWIMSQVSPFLVFLLWCSGWIIRNFCFLVEFLNLLEFYNAHNSLQENH